MTPKEFWHCTPRKLSALCLVHADLNDPKKHSKQAASSKTKRVNSHDRGGGVGIPNAFIDQI